MAIEHGFLRHKLTFAMEEELALHPVAWERHFPTSSGHIENIINDRLSELARALSVKVFGEMRQFRVTTEWKSRKRLDVNLELQVTASHVRGVQCATFYFDEAKGTHVQGLTYPTGDAVVKISALLKSKDFSRWSDNDLVDLAIATFLDLTGYLDKTLGTTDAASEQPNATEGETRTLTPLQKKIREAVQELKSDYADPPDEIVASKVGLNPRGQPYVRETINRERSKMRKLKIDV